MASAFREPAAAPSTALNVSPEQYLAMRQATAEEIDHCILLLKSYTAQIQWQRNTPDKPRAMGADGSIDVRRIDSSAYKPQPRSKEELAALDSLEMEIHGYIRQLQQLKKNLPPEGVQDPSAAAISLYGVAGTADRILGGAFATAFTSSYLPMNVSMENGNMQLFATALSSYFTFMSENAGNLAVAPALKNPKYVFGGACQYPDQEGNKQVYLIGAGDRQAIQNDYTWLANTASKAADAASNGRTDEALRLLSDMRPEAINTAQGFRKQWTDGAVRYSKYAENEGKTGWQKTGAFLKDNPWVADLGVVGVSVAAEIGTFGTGSPAVVTYCGAYFMGRGVQEMMNDYSDNGRLTQRGYMGALMALAPAAKVLKGLEIGSPAAQTFAESVSSASGITLMGVAGWDALSIAYHASQNYGMTTMDWQSIGTNFAFLFAGFAGGVLGSKIKLNVNSEVSKGMVGRDFGRITTELDTMIDKPGATNVELVSGARDAVDDIGQRVNSRDGRLELAGRKKEYSDLAKQMRESNDPTLAKLGDFIDSEMGRAAKQAEAKGMAGKYAKSFEGLEGAEEKLTKLEDAFYNLGSPLANKYIGLIVGRIQNGADWGSPGEFAKYNKAGLTGQDVEGAYQTKQRYNAGEDLLATQTADVLLKRAATLRKMGDPTTADFIEAAVKRAQKPAAQRQPSEALQAASEQQTTGARQASQPQLQVVEASAEETWASWRKSKASIDHVTTGDVTYAARADQAVGERTWLKLEMQNGRLVPTEVISAEEAAGVRVSARVVGLEKAHDLAAGRQVARIPEEAETEQTYEQQQAAKNRQTPKAAPAAEPESTRETVRGRQPGGTAVDLGAVRLRTGEKPPGAKPMPTVEFTTEQLASMTSLDLATIRGRNGRYATIHIEGMDPVSGSLRTEYRGKGADRQLYVSVDRTNKVFWPVDMLQKLVLDPVEAGKAKTIPADNTATKVKPGRQPIEGQTYKLRLQRPFSRAETVEGAFTDENLAAMRQWEGKIVAVYGKNGELLAMGKLRIGSVNAEDKTFQITQLDPSWGAPREGRMPNIRARTTFRFDEVGKVDMLDWKLFPSINLSPLVVDRTYKTKQEISEGTYGTSMIRIRDGQTQSTYFARRIDKVTMSDGTVKYEMIAVPCMRMQAGIGQISGWAGMLNAMGVLHGKEGFMEMAQHMQSTMSGGGISHLLGTGGDFVGGFATTYLGLSALNLAWNQFAGKPVRILITDTMQIDVMRLNVPVLPQVSIDFLTRLVPYFPKYVTDRVSVADLGPMMESGAANARFGGKWLRFVSTDPAEPARMVYLEKFGAKQAHGLEYFGTMASDLTSGAYKWVEVVDVDFGKPISFTRKGVPQTKDAPADAIAVELEPAPLPPKVQQLAETGAKALENPAALDAEDARGPPVQRGAPSVLTAQDGRALDNITEEGTQTPEQAEAAAATIAAINEKLKQSRNKNDRELRKKLIMAGGIVAVAGTALILGTCVGQVWLSHKAEQPADKEKTEAVVNLNAPSTAPGKLADEGGKPNANISQPTTPPTAPAQQGKPAAPQQETKQVGPQPFIGPQLPAGTAAPQKVQAPAYEQYIPKDSMQLYQDVERKADFQNQNREEQADASRLLTLITAVGELEPKRKGAMAALFKDMAEIAGGRKADHDVEAIAKELLDPANKWGLDEKNTYLNILNKYNE
jgi:hypothetical protein